MILKGEDLGKYVKLSEVPVTVSWWTTESGQGILYIATFLGFLSETVQQQ